MRDAFPTSHLPGAFTCGVVSINTSGNLNASKADMDLMKKVKEGGKLMEIQLPDHIILTNEKYYSIADDGPL